MNRKNLANAELASAITSTSATSATVKTGQGALLPATPFYATITPVGVLSTLLNSEIVKVTTVSGDTLTIIRGRRGTSAKTFDADSIIGNGAYAEDLDIKASTSTAVGTAAKVATTVEGGHVPEAGQKYIVTFVNGNSVASPTLNIDASGAFPIRLGNTAANTTVFSVTGSIDVPLYFNGTAFQLYGSYRVTDSDTVVTEITSAEITAGIATTTRAITGRRAQEIVVKAQTGVVKSTTTANLTASTTAPGSPTTGDVWIDTNDLPETLAPSSIVWKETPTGLVNSSNTTYTTSQAYTSGSLQVFINGLANSGMTTETAPGSGTFTITPAPLTGDNISVQYQVRVTATGNADTVDSYHASATPTANTLSPLDATARNLWAIMPVGSQRQIGYASRDNVGTMEASYAANASNIIRNDANTANLGATFTNTETTLYVTVELVVWGALGYKNLRVTVDGLTPTSIPSSTPVSYLTDQVTSAAMTFTLTGVTPGSHTINAILFRPNETGLISYRNANIKVVEVKS